MDMRFARYAVIGVVLMVSALSMLGAGGGTGGHPTRTGGTTYVPPLPPAPPKPFYLKPGWLRRVVPYSGSTTFTGDRRWALPSYIVDCESGGDYTPDEGLSFGGAYGILVSTWLEYGGGKYASQANYAKYWQQDQIAHKVWIDVGPSGWECA